ncbi:MAG: sugar ABC transporter substrate-binding protein, partial [Pseudomonadota bacterium]|nr:sugar ABC transporter substrate-binding protein [Pseudomonadota bacterium]
MPAYKDLVVVSPPYISSSELYLGISEADDQKDSIKQAFEEGFAHLKRSGTYQEILSRYQIDDNILMIPDETPVATYLEPNRLRSLKGSGLPPRTIKASSDNINVAIIGFSWATDTYQSTYIKQFTEMAETLGVNVAIHDAKGSVDQQNNLMKQVIDSKPDVVALWPVHGEKVKPALQYAYEAGVPVFLVNTPVAEGLWKYVRGYIGPDNYKEGRLAAEMMDTALGGKGKVVEIQGFPGYKTAVLRSLGFHHYLQERRQHDSEFDIEVIDVSSGYWSRERSYTTMERVIRRHSEFDGLYAADDNMALGAMQALTDANWPTDFKVTSATLFGDGYDAIKQGKIWGSVWQSPTEEADLAVKTLVRFMLGDDVPLLTFLPVKPITKSALENTVRPEF